MPLIPSRFFGLLFALAAGLMPAAAIAATLSSGVDRRLEAAAENGPRALLDGLSQLLASKPALAATPASAAALAAAAAAPVPDFEGANLPVYREIADRIVRAAPLTQRQAVRVAVDGVLEQFIVTDIRIMPSPIPRTIGTAATQPPDIGGPGYKVGSFTLYPTLQAGLFYDSNIYATRTGRVSDVVGTISPNIIAESNWAHSSLQVNAGTDLSGYWTHGSENMIDWHLGAEGHIDASRSTRILLGVQTLREHEDRFSPDAVEGLTPTPYRELNSYVGVVHRLGNFSLRVGGAVERLTFGNVEGLHGLIDNHDRDRSRFTFGVLLRDDAQPAFRPFVEALGDVRRYDQSPDDFGYFRNSGGYRSGLGTLFAVSSNVSGEAFIGVMGRAYADSRFKSITTVASDGYVRWQATKRTAALLFLDRSIEETTLPGSPAYIYTVVGGRLEQDLWSSLTAFIRLAFARCDFVQTSRWDNEADMSVGARYYFNPSLYLGVDYRYTQRISQESVVNFDRNQVVLVMGTSF